MAQVGKLKSPTKTAWKALTLADIDAILQAAGIECLAGRKSVLVVRINHSIHLFSQIRDFRRRAPPGRRIEELKRMSAAAERLLQAFNRCNDKAALSYEFDRISGLGEAASLDELHKALPDDPEEFILAAVNSGARLESSAARECISAATEGVRLLKNLANASAKSVERVQQSLNPGRARRRPDDVRWGLVEEIAVSFERILQQSAVMTDDGAWLKFLAAAMSHIEGKEFTPDGAKSLWLDVREWQRSEQSK